MKLDAPSVTLSCMLGVILYVVLVYSGGCESCGHIDPPLPTLTPFPAPHPHVTHDEDAGDDAGVSERDREWREIITPQPARERTTPRDHCSRPAYRNKRECKSETRVRRRHANHYVGC